MHLQLFAAGATLTQQEVTRLHVAAITCKPCKTENCQHEVLLKPPVSPRFLHAANTRGNHKICSANIWALPPPPSRGHDQLLLDPTMASAKPCRPHEHVFFSSKPRSKTFHILRYPSHFRAASPFANPLNETCRACSPEASSW